MVKRENHCVDCGLPCQGDACPNRNVEVWYCDKCHDEIPYGEVYEADGYDLCEDCLKEMFKKE